MSRDFFNRDMELFLERRLDWGRYFRLREGDASIAPDELETYRAVLRTAGDVCADIETDSAPGWHEEARLEDGEVVVPGHITRGYERLRSAGLLCLSLGSEHGGFGLPLLLNTMFLEMLARADASLMTIVGLQTGVANDIERYGTPEIAARYLPRFASGELQGAMDLTEAGAGSDLGAISTRVRVGADHCTVDGEKIFITNGGAHVHLVLARDEDGFADSKGSTTGLSLVLVPRVRPDGSPNGVRIERSESKLGLHGSPTCVVAFDEAHGELLGERGQGFRAMLDLMNAARLGVAAQAIGTAEAAYREARDYAGQRIQFGAPILDQPLVKSMLVRMEMHIQAARALLYSTCALVDMTDALRRHLASGRATDEERGALEEEVATNGQLIRFLTPLCKYYATEISVHATRLGIQVHGGVGYMAETRAGHLHSDAIITTIYEGTSEIQASFALKEMAKGALPAALLRLRAQLEGVAPELRELADQVEGGIGWIERSLPALLGDPRYALLNAKRLSEMAADVLISAELLVLGSFDEEKALLAATFVHRRMLEVEMNARRISAGDGTRITRYDRILGYADAA